MPYGRDLGSVVDMEIIRAAGLNLAVDPMGGAGLAYWSCINRVYDLGLSIVNTVVDPTFSFMTVDHDGKIRTDCSSPFAMARLIGLKDQYRLAFGNDPDASGHGIVTPQAGLLNPSHYRAVALHYFLTHRPLWPEQAAGDESAGFLRRDGSVWTTDKDGLVMNLLAAEITASTGKDPGEHE